jgi:hypothetical protein
MAAGDIPAVVLYIPPLLILDRRLLGRFPGLFGDIEFPPFGELLLVTVCKVVTGLLPHPGATVFPGLGTPGPLV